MRYLSILPGLLFVPLMLVSLHVKALSLIEAYELALKNDSTYQAAISEHEAGQHYATIGRANLLPNVSASYAYNKNDTDITVNGRGPSRTENRDYSSETAAIQARQPLFNLESWAKYQLGKAQTALSDKVFSAKAQELIARIFSLYAQANYAENVVQLAVAQRDAYSLQHQSSTKLALLGEGTKTDILESKAKLDLAEAQLIEATSNLNNDRNALAIAIGASATSLHGLSENTILYPSEKNLEEWKNTALDNNPEIAAKLEEVEIAAQEIKRNQAGHYPRLDAVASISKSDSDSIPTYQQKLETQSIGIQLNIPIYAGHSVTALSAQAIANHEKTKHELEAKTNEILLELQKQFSLVSSGEHRIKALQQSVSSAELLVTATEKSVLAGTRTNLDVLNAKKQLTEAKRDLALARFKYLVSYINLRKAAGTLSIADLEKISNSFVTSSTPAI